nr:hypothetical protein [Tanacetum cinerariifolium]
MFDKYLNPPPCVDPQVPTVVTPEPAVQPTMCTQSTNHLNTSTNKPKDHPLDNVIGDPSRLVSARHQLQDEALLCYFDAFLSSVKPKSYKDVLTESCWIEAMQEELNKFKHLEVWELAPRPDHFFIITLKWIYKVKLDELR